MSDGLAPGAELRRNPRVLSREIDGEAVLLHPERGTYFGLDAVGARIWALLSEPITVGRLVSRLLGEYEVSRERLEADLDHLLQELRHHDLVEVVAPDQMAAGPPDPAGDR